MKLDDLTGKPISSPDEAQIRKALDLVYREEREAVILVDEGRSDHHFLQVAMGGGYLEYRDGPESKIMAVNHISLPLCQEIFLDYARGGIRWKTLVEWSSSENLQPGIQTGSGSRRFKPGLLVILGILGTAVGCLWIYLLTVLPLAEVLISSGALLVALLNYVLIRRNQRLKFVPTLVCSGIFLLLWMGLTALSLILSLAANNGRVSVSTISVLLLGGFSIYLAGTRVQDSILFNREAEVVEADSARLVLVDNTSEGMLHKELAYTYLGKYHGQHNSIGIRYRSRAISRALAENRLQIKIRYLPSDPEVHRFAGWKIRMDQ